jgi:membrane protease YdiL (CAAX protease family)
MRAKMKERIFWSYEDLGVFFLLAALLALILRALVRFGVLPQSDLEQLDDSLQLVIVSVLIVGLFAVLKMRRPKHLLTSLGWVLPGGAQLFLSLLTGALLAAGVLLYTHGKPRSSPVPSIEGIISICLLGPVLEETLFRGCLLPLIATAVGNPLAIVASAGLFAVFHGPADIVHGTFFAICGIMYGWIRETSGTNTTPAIAHAVCNLALLYTLGH